MLTKYQSIICCFINFLILSCNVYANENTQLCSDSEIISDNSFFVATNGHDYEGNGSRLKPWRTIEFAIHKATENSTIVVKPGTYQGSIRIKRKFEKALLIKSEIPYQARLINNSRVLAIVGKASNITIEGFEITHIDSNASPLVVHIDGWGSPDVHHINLKNNIIHDSFNNDLLKINYGAHHITVECNIFYNQGDSDEHIDINSVNNITIRNNLFFNDFEASGRKISNKSSSYIVIKDSNGDEDSVLGASDIYLDGNIFFNWQGSLGYGFILVGEDGKNYYEAFDIHIFNNLMLGNSPISMRSPFGVKGARDIWFYNNSIVGDLPSNAFAVRVNSEGKNLTSTGLYFYNNIWSDPFGTMGIGDSEKNIDFSDTYLHQIKHFELNNNLVWNGGLTLPHSYFDAINPNDDDNLISVSPSFADNSRLMTPYWRSTISTFNDGSFSISEVFKRIIYLYGTPEYPDNIKIKNKNKNKQNAPPHDIIGNIRTTPQMLGAFHVNIKEHNK